MNLVNGSDTNIQTGSRMIKKMNRNETRTNAQLNLKYEISFNERTYTRTLKI